MKSKTIPSKYNGTLEVTMQRGRKVLHSKNTNYSYGNVQSVWTEMLNKTPLQGVKNILLLGLGGGSVVDILQHHLHYKGTITAVEIDPVIVQIAADEFGITNTNTLTIECMDANDYVQGTRKKYDLILVDIFIDKHMPDILLSLEFWQNIAKCARPKSTIVFNAFNSQKKLAPITLALENLGYALTLYTKVNGTNTMLVAQK
jgi:spermidine synthase